jgi:predicted RNA-binding protein with TRAM domain
MKKKIIGIFICMLLIATMLPIVTMAGSESDPEITADLESKLRAGVFGASMLALREAGGIIWNDGLDTILDVQYTFTVKGGHDNSIDITISGYAGDGDMEVNQVYTISTNEAKGYGPVTLTMTATSSNAGEATATSQGFQIGPYTISKTYLMAWF